MKSRLLFLIKYYFFWLAVFIIQKIFFLFFNYKESFELIITDWFLILFNGLKLDLSAGAYILVIPALVMAFEFLTGLNFIQRFLKIYTGIFLFIVLYLGVVDMDLYSYWGFKLDITPLIYLKTPGEALASVPLYEIILLMLLFLLLFLGFLRAYKILFSPPFHQESVRWWKSPVGSLLFIVFLALPARGGFDIVPINLSSVYFHQNRFANHSAINVLWNTIYSCIEREKLKEKVNFMDNELAREYFSALYPAPSPGGNRIVKDNPNIVLVIIESFSNKIIEALGGETDITPCFNELCSRSVVFSNFYASGDRSDKGIVSIFSGFPAQPLTSIIDYPSKSQNLPFFMKHFHEKGYQTAFYYGGDLNFANFKSYLSSPYLDALVTINDFEKTAIIQKWGVADESLFNRMLQDIDHTSGSFFYSCLTLSSHEPFDVPGEALFGKMSRDDLSRNAFHYTDQCICDFLEKAYNSPWWDNTLIIFTADHGSRSPGNTPNHVEEKFRIPMIWTGGAVLQDTIITKIGSQTDIAVTLLGQFDVMDPALSYGKNLLDPNAASFAFYAFNNGFGFKTDNSIVIFDNDLNQPIQQSGKGFQDNLNSGKAFLQVLSEDFYQKK